MSVAQTSYRYWRSRGYNAQSAVAKARTDTQARYTSKPVRFGAFGTDPKDATQYVERDSVKALRIRYADDVITLRHTGHFADNWAGERIFRGVVIQIPAHKGETRYLAGYEDLDGESYIIERNATWDCETGAAYRADQLAELEADKEREYCAAFQAGNLYAENLDAISYLRTRALGILKARKETPNPFIRDELAKSVSGILETIYNLRSENAELRGGDRDFMTFYPNAVNMVAFNEGFIASNACESLRARS